MTALQMEANKLRETERSNLAKERENERSNRAREIETHRSNLEQERKIDSEIFKNTTYGAEKASKIGYNINKGTSALQDVIYRPKAESREDLKAVMSVVNGVGKFL